MTESPETTFNRSITMHHAARDAFARLAQLTDCTPECSTDPYRPDDAHMLNSSELRNLLIALFDDDMPDDADAPDLAEMHALLLIIRESLISIDTYPDSQSREKLTEIALSHSLCPIHLIDYAICFDDDDADCAQIRLIHPSKYG